MSEEGALGSLRRARSWVPRWAGLATFLIGLIDIGSAATHALRGRLMELATLVPGVFTDFATAATLVSGLLLLLLAHGLRRRKRRAWRAVVALLALSVVLHVVKGLDVEEALISLALLAVLVVYRGEFYALGDPRTRWRALGALVVMGSLSTLIGLALVGLRHHGIVGHPPFVDRLTEVLLGLVGIDGPLKFRTERTADIISFTLVLMGSMTAVTTAYLFLRPAEPSPGLTADDETRMRALLAHRGHQDSLGYFNLRRDKSVLWSPSGKSCIAFRVVSGVMLASGDPMGDPEAWPGAIEAFQAEADRHAWVPAVIGCSERAGRVWCRVTGMDALELGDEATVLTEEFTLEGREMRNVRQMVNRVERAGYSTYVMRLRDADPSRRAQLAQQKRAWRGSKVERGFSMALGRIGDPADDDCVIAVAMRDGAIRAFQHFVPWGDDGLSLDLMRRDRGADAGVNELLIAELLKAAPSLGVRRVSLNFAVFRSVFERGERLGAGPVLRAWRGLLVFGSRWFQLESLYRFNAKFNPTWYPRYLVFPSGGSLPRIAVAALEAEAFLVWPRLERLAVWRRRPRRPATPQTAPEPAPARGEPAR